MTAIELRQPDEAPASAAASSVERRASRRDEVETLGLLVAILGILLVLALVLGTAQYA